MVDSSVGELGADAFPAPEPRRVGLVDAGFGRLRQGEQRLLRGEVLVEELTIDAVVDDAEEADLVADRGQPLGERHSISVDTVPAGDRHHRNLSKPHATTVPLARAHRRAVSSAHRRVVPSSASGVRGVAAS